MTNLAKAHKTQLSTLVQQLLPAHDVASWSAETELVGAIAEFDSMLLVNLLTAIETSFEIEIDESELSLEVFESWGNLQRYVYSLTQT